MGVNARRLNIKFEIRKFEIFPPGAESQVRNYLQGIAAAQTSKRNAVTSLSRTRNPARPYAARRGQQGKQSHQ